MYRPRQHHQHHQQSFWFPALGRARAERDWDYDYDEWETEYDDDRHRPRLGRRAVSFDEGRSTVRFIDPRHDPPAPRSSPRPKTRAPLPAVEGSPTERNPPSSSALVIHVDRPAHTTAPAKPASSGVESKKYLPPLLSLRDFCKEYHIQRETFIKLERMGIKGPASLQYLDPEYLVNPEGVLHRGHQVPGLFPPELSEVKVAVERWQAGVPARGRYLRGGK